METLMGVCYRLRTEERDLDEDDIERITPAGSLVQISGYDSVAGLFDITCEETGAWFRFTRKEIETDLEEVLTS